MNGLRDRSSDQWLAWWAFILLSLGFYILTLI